MSQRDRSPEARADAAERTAAVLKRRLRAIDAGEEKTVIQRQLESAQRRALEVERRRALTELRTRELERYNANLEGEVAARTEQIRTILDHVAAGLLLINHEAVVEPGYSRCCEALLGTSEITGMSLPRLLKLTDAQRVDYELALSQVFDDALPEVLTTHQVPRTASPAGRKLELSYSVVREQGVPRRVLVTILDVTARVEAELAVKHQARLVHILTHRHAFEMFVSDTRQRLREAEHAVRDHQSVFVRRAVHTIKGNSATFGLDEIVRVCHEVEDAQVIDADALQRIGDALRLFLASNRHLLGLDPASEREPSRSYLLTHSLIDQLAHSARSPDEDALPRLLARIRQRPANDFVEPLRAAAVRLGERLEKDIAFVVVGGDTAIDPVRLGPLLNCLPHLVRNAVDHGIEAPADRGHKPAQGTVQVSFRDCEDSWEVIVADDGRGIDPTRILAHAVEKGLLAGEQAEQLAASPLALSVMTMDGFSTSETVNDVSGRGVGLSAVRGVVESVGGSMELDSQPGRGSRFRIVVPKIA